jgi:hypothetical protein
MVHACLKMPVAFAMVQVPSTSVDVLTFLMATAIATATNSTRLAYVAVNARQMPMPTASVMTWTTALELSTLVAYATA